MFGKVQRVLRDESGLSALETAIVLIAFVVVAAVFAFTMLSAGMFSTERSKEAVYAGLEEVRGSMELRGGVVVTSTGTSVDTVIFTVSNVAGGEAIDLTDTENDDNKVVIDYRDANQMKSGLEWDVSWPVRADSDDLLEDGELAEITVSGLTTGTNQLDTSLAESTLFALEVKPPKGGVLILERTTPDAIDTIMDLQ